MWGTPKRTHLQGPTGLPLCQARPRDPLFATLGETNCQQCEVKLRNAPGPNQILRCARCKQEKPGAEFHTCPSKATGRHSYCKPCFLEWEKANRKTKRRSVSEREKRYYHANPIHKREAARRNDETKPKAVYARQVIRNEIKRGRLKRGLCEVCGTDFAVHGHHDDYNRPLVVRWLCGVHHKEWHERNGPGANIEGEPVLIGRTPKRSPRPEAQDGDDGEKR
jgi:hypothetical protein